MSQAAVPCASEVSRQGFLSGRSPGERGGGLGFRVWGGGWGAILGYILGLYGANGKENGNYCNGLYRVLDLRFLELKGLGLRVDGFRIYGLRFWILGCKVCCECGVEHAMDKLQGNAECVVACKVLPWPDWKAI